MHRRRCSPLVRVHRWLFYLSLVVVIGSALSRIENDARPGDDTGDDTGDARVVAFAGCP